MNLDPRRHVVGSRGGRDRWTDGRSRGGEGRRSRGGSKRETHAFSSGRWRVLGPRRLGGADADWPGLLLDRASGARARARARTRTSPSVPGK